MTDEVKFTDAQWDELARAGEAFATVLEEQQSLLRAVLVQNWAGQCEEGNGLLENLRAIVHGGDSSFVQAIDAEAKYLRSHAAVCRSSRDALQSVDDQNSNDLVR